MAHWPRKLICTRPLCGIWFLRSSSATLACEIKIWMCITINMYVYFCLTTKTPYSTCSELRIGRVRMSVKEYDSESHNRYPFSLICDHQTCHSRFCKFSQLHTTCSDLCTTNIHTSVAKIWFGPFFTKRYISRLCAEICFFSNSGLAGVIFVGLPGPRGGRKRTLREKW